MPDADDGGTLTWGEWEQPELSFEDSIPDGANTAVERGVQDHSNGEQTDVFDYAIGNYQIPTATSNPERPRTVAAKFDPDEGAVYVVMRSYQSHGRLKTPVVRYSPLKMTDWKNFRAAYSKGRYILNNWDNQISYEEIGDTGGFDAFLITAANYARSQQVAREGLQAGQHASSDVYKKLRKAVAEGRRVSDVKLRSDKLGGTGRKRRQNTDLDAAVNAFYRNSSPPTIG